MEADDVKSLQAIKNLFDLTDRLEALGMLGPKMVLDTTPLGNGARQRDECEREKPCDQYPWDGVRNVRPFSRFQKSVVEGVY